MKQKTPLRIGEVDSFSESSRCRFCNATRYACFISRSVSQSRPLPPELAPRLAASSQRLVAGLLRAVIPPPLWMKKRGQRQNLSQIMKLLPNLIAENGAPVKHKLETTQGCCQVASGDCKSWRTMFASNVRGNTSQANSTCIESHFNVRRHVCSGLLQIHLLVSGTLEMTSPCQLKLSSVHTHRTHNLAMLFEPPDR